MEGPAPLGRSALHYPTNDDFVPLVPDGGAQRLVVLGDLDNPRVGDGLGRLLASFVLRPHLSKALFPGQTSLELGKFIMGVEETLELNLVQDVQDLG